MTELETSPIHQESTESSEKELQCIKSEDGLIPLSEVCEGCSATLVGLRQAEEKTSLGRRKHMRQWKHHHGPRGKGRRHRHGPHRNNPGSFGQPGLTHRLAELGFCHGTQIRVVVSRNPGPIMVEVRGSRIGLDSRVASQILVRPHSALKW